MKNIYLDSQLLVGTCPYRPYLNLRLYGPREHYSVFKWGDFERGVGRAWDPYVTPQLAALLETLVQCPCHAHDARVCDSAGDYDRRLFIPC